MNFEVDWSEIKPVKGFALGTTAAGIKYTDRDDLLVAYFGEKSTVAGVFTQNDFAAAPIAICRERISNPVQALVINSGNANACTGNHGYDDAQKICRNVASNLGISEEAVLPFSTGVVGELLPTEKICNALPNAVAELSELNWEQAAKAIMTTDTKPKAVSHQVNWQGHSITITGMSKGAGMIRPNMATMLAFVAIDSPIAQSVLNKISLLAANKSFNRITIDGDTSTNDSCVLVATGEAAAPALTELSGEYFALISNAVISVYEQLAQAIVFDGEGATKFVEVVVEGGESHQECLDVAYTIAHSPLVKTACFASDPNWGRIVVAIGNAGVKNLNIKQVRVWLDEVLIVEAGGRAKNYREEDGQSVFDKECFAIRVDLSRGDAVEKIWTSDLSHEYVRINAEYRT